VQQLLPVLGEASNIVVLSSAAARTVAGKPLSKTLHFLLTPLAAVLLFTGAQMIGSEWVRISPGVSVGIIGLVLAVTIAVSMWPRQLRETVR
jgi:hypothetical protein